MYSPRDVRNSCEKRGVCNVTIRSICKYGKNGGMAAIWGNGWIWGGGGGQFMLMICTLARDKNFVPTGAVLL